jgi:hypothetical protein
MNRRPLLAAALAAAAAGVAASTAAPAGTALVSCGKVTAGGKAWLVTAAGVKCSTAQGIVRQVAAKRPDHVLRSGGGVIDQYAASFSGLKCFKAQKPKLGGEIQCTSADGRKTVLATYRG